MNVFDILATFVALAALFSYLNLRFLHAPRMVAMLIGGLVSAVVITAADRLVGGAALGSDLKLILAEVDFGSLVLQDFLGFIIFAGALEVDFEVLRNRVAAVGALASAGVLISTFVIGAAAYGMLRGVGEGLPFVTCLLLGAIISPTDPVAVLGIMRELSVTKRLQVEASGESLFNDGVGIVLFVTLLMISGGTSGPGATAANVALLFLREAGGGCVAGLILGWFVYMLLKPIDDPNVEVFLSFALVVMLAALGARLHFSAPIASAVAGLLIGHLARADAMKEDTRHALDTLWSFTDHVLNMFLFLIIGLETVAIGMPSRVRGITIAVAIPLAIFARFASVWAASLLLPRHSLPLRSVVALTWGGIRGAVSIALALSLPRMPGREFLIQATFATVLFSIIVQGLTVRPLLRKLSLDRQSEL